MKKYIIIFSHLFILFSCGTSDSRWEKDNGKIISTYSDNKIKAKIILQDDGAFGYSGLLKVQKNDKKVIYEEIGLRAEDDLPKIDSVKGVNVYISYDLNIESKIEFNDVVLGEARIGNKKLLFNYHFNNRHRS